MALPVSLGADPARTSAGPATPARPGAAGPRRPCRRLKTATHPGREGRGNQAVGKSGGPARYRLARAASAQVLLVTVLVAACENPLAPVSCGSVPDQTIPVGKSVGLRVCFTDENGDRVSLSAKSSRSGVAVVGTSGSTVTVTGRSGGTATVTVTARDPGGLLGTVSFSVWVPAIVQLTDDCGYFPVWSPDGTRLAFLSKRHFACRWGWGLGLGVYVMNADGSGATNLTGDMGFTVRGSLAWSPDGTRIAFEARSDVRSRGEIYVINADGSGVKILTNDPAWDYAPAWSPDGTRIAFSRRYGDDWALYVMNADGSGVKNLTNDSASDAAPAWSPDGTRIAFSSRRDGNLQLYVMNADGSGATNLTGDMGFTVRGSLAWSPDGTRIAFEARSDVRSRGEIYVINADGSGVKILTNDPAWDYAPAWSPDGTRIAFSRRSGDDWALYVMNADGSGATDLALGKAPFSSWSPDGRKIAFTCSNGGVCLVDLSEGRRR